MKNTVNPAKIPRTIIYMCGDIIEEILSRLPVKSLLKFRCVSKSWCYLISSNKDFIKSHLNNSTPQKSLIASLTDCEKGSLYSRLMQIPLDSFFTAPTCFVEDFIINDLKFYSFELVGSCNGLCCLLINGKQLFLWNPSTKKSHKLPDVDGHIHYELVAGFGFDEANNDYKILAIYQINVDGVRVKVFKLYSMSTNCWKLVKNNFPYDNYSIRDTGKFLNGKLHWHVFNRSYHIVSFDLESEVFGLVKKPNLEDNRGLYVGVLDGCLSCSFIKSSNNVVQVWVMKEYGIQESWYLQANISNPISGLNSNFTKPIHMSQGGEILFSTLSGFIVYNPKTEKGRYLQLSPSYMCAYGYVESLVSPVPVGKPEIMPQEQG